MCRRKDTQGSWDRCRKTHLRTSRHRALIAVIVEARLGAGLTQRQLTSRLGRSNSFVWKFEAGERSLKVLEFVDVAEALGVPPDELLRRVMGD